MVKIKSLIKMELNGIKQLRKRIAESKLSFEIIDDGAQAFRKRKIIDNIHEYYHLIVFDGYMLDAVSMK